MLLEEAVQSEQLPPIAVVNVPAGHGMQFELLFEPIGEMNPIGQDLQTTADSVSEYVLARHSGHDARPD
jgi:hypothetical protein